MMFDEQPTLSARLGHLKHGPGGSGLAGPCDPDCRKCAVERQQKLAFARTVAHLTSPQASSPTIETPSMPVDGPPVDPLDTKYDGWTLRHLLEVNSAIAEERPVDERLPHPLPIPMTSTQRAAVSARWSAELRAKVDASKERDRNRVTMEHDE